MTTPLTNQEKIALALTDIKDAGLNSYRCYLTGAPYAYIIDSEIEFALESELREDKTLTVGRLVDNWELKAIAISNQMLPSLRGSSSHALIPHLRDGVNGNARIATYMLTRLLFPHIGTKGLESDARRMRAAFSRQCHDWLAGKEMSVLAEMTQRLTAIDAYCAMPLWHSLWSFESIHSDYGVHNAPKAVRAAFYEPESLIGNVATVTAVIEFMFRLMLQITERDGAAGKGGSRLAQRILVLEAEVAKPQPIPMHQKREVSQADLLRMENQRKIAANQTLRIAHSAIHGPKHRPGGGLMDSNALMAAMAAKAAKKQANHEAKPAAKKKSTINPMLAKAFAAVSPLFTFEEK